MSTQTTRNFSKIELILTLDPFVVRKKLFSLPCYVFRSSSLKSFLKKRRIGKNLFLDIETTIKVKLGSILEKTIPRHNQREQTKTKIQHDCENKKFAYNHFLRVQEKQVINLQKYLQRYPFVLFAFGFYSGKDDLSLIKIYLLLGSQ